MARHSAQGEKPDGPDGPDDPDELDGTAGEEGLYLVVVMDAVTDDVDLSGRTNGTPRRPVGRSTAACPAPQCMLARVVLESWNIQSTDDFGRIVFGFIDLDLMQKQVDDKIEDFEKIFPFEDAFRMPFPPVPGTAHEDDDEPLRD